MKQKFIWEQFMDKKFAQENVYNIKTVTLVAEILFCSDEQELGHTKNRSSPNFAWLWGLGRIRKKMVFWY